MDDTYFLFRPLFSLFDQLDPLLFIGVPRGGSLPLHRRSCFFEFNFGDIGRDIFDVYPSLLSNSEGQYISTPTVYEAET